MKWSNCMFANNIVNMGRYIGVHLGNDIIGIYTDSVVLNLIHNNCGLYCLV